MDTKHRVAVGIDFGMSNIRVARVNKMGRPQVVSNGHGDLATPSFVLFESAESWVVGKEAENSISLYPGDCIESPQRFLGDQNWVFHYRGKSFSAEDICVILIKQVTEDAEAQINTTITDATFACPDHWNHLARSALIRAARRAGITTVHVISVAAAVVIDYRSNKRKYENVLVYDMGGRSFNVGLAHIAGEETELLATSGADDLGGYAWCARIVEFLAREWMQEMGSTDNPTDSFDSLQNLWLRAEDAKKALSTREQTRIVVSHAGQNIPVTLTREKFDELTAGLLEQTVLVTRQLLNQGRKKGYARFDKLLLVGGATRMPQVATRLEQEFGKGTIVRLHQPELVTAKGAAIWARRLLLDEQQSGTPATTGSMTTSANIFISYKRSDRPIVVELAEKLGGDNHQVWFDQELIGGHDWWAEILQHIRDSDTFLFMLTPASLASDACQRECEYAHALGKHVIPVLIADKVNMRLLPSWLQAIQAVDYRAQDDDAWRRLAQAVRQRPAPAPLPNPLPTPPLTPLSPLGEINQRLSATSLGQQEQMDILIQLKWLLYDEDVADEARELLRRMWRRPDLLYRISEEIRPLIE